jgi:hypothetical protein
MKPEREAFSMASKVESMIVRIEFSYRDVGFFRKLCKMQNLQNKRFAKFAKYKKCKFRERYGFESLSVGRRI